jgi:multidrug efflux pump subunit AcrA (membrane-fusion protein)
VPIGERHKALLVTELALDTDQGRRIVYIVNKENKVVSRPVQVGAPQDSLRVIEDGLKLGDRVIVNGLQQVRPGAAVEPTIVEMPTFVATSH